MQVVTPLLESHVGELVWTKLVSLGLVGVVSLDGLDVLDEDAQALDELGSVGELELELLHVIVEHRLEPFTRVDVKFNSRHEGRGQDGQHNEKSGKHFKYRISVARTSGEGGKRLELGFLFFDCFSQATPAIT